MHRCRDSGHMQEYAALAQPAARSTRFRDGGARPVPVVLDAGTLRGSAGLIKTLTEFVRSRPPQSVASFMQQSNAVIAHDAEAQLHRITAPTLITFGWHNVPPSTRFAQPLTSKIRNSELVIFENCSHAPIYEKVEEFNAKTLGFLQRHAGSSAASGAA